MLPNLKVKKDCSRNESQIF